MHGFIQAPNLGTFSLLILLVAAVVSGLNWRMHRALPGPGWWFAGSLAYVACTALLLLRGVLPDLLSIVLANVVLVGGMGMMLLGSCAFAGTAAPWRIVLGAQALVAAGFCYLLYVQPSFLARWWVLALGAATVMLSGLHSQHRIAKEDGWLGVILYTVSTVGGAVVMLAMPAGLTWGERGVDSLFGQSTTQAWGLLLMALLMALHTFGIVLMTSNRVHRRLQRQALVDGLTGLSNRRAFDEALARSIENAARSRRAVGLMLVDIDHFKRVNDTHGHGVGDAVLREVALRIVAAVRSGDQAARIGGEEFAAIVHDPLATALADVAERVRSTVSSKPVQAQGIEMRVTVSVGVAHLPADGVYDARALLNRADDALYSAKRQGRDRVVHAGEPDLRPVLELAR